MRIWILSILFSSASWAAPEVDSLPAKDLVTVEYSPNFALPYRERRTSWGFQLGLDYESYFPGNFESGVDQTGYGDLFGDRSLQMASLRLGTKYNFSFGAITMELIGSSGMVNGNDANGARRTLYVAKQALGLGLTFDALFSEPYFAPYMRAEFFQMQWRESGTSNSAPAIDKGSTEASVAYVGGLLVRLNSLDFESVSREANYRYGFNNLFLDLYIIHYVTPAGDNGPDLGSATNLSYGAGLLFEY